MKRICRIILITFITLTPLFWYGVYKIGSIHVNKLVNEYMNGKYGQEIDQLKQQMDKIQEEYIAGSGSSREVFSATKEFGDILLAFKGKASVEFFNEHKGLKSRWYYIYPSVLSLIYLTLLIVVLKTTNRKS